MKIVQLLVLLVVSFSLGFPQVPDLKIPEGTKIRVRLEQDLSSESAEENQGVQLSVIEQVKIGEVVVIPQGANVTGRVVQAVPKRRMGRTGKIDFSVERVIAADNQTIPLRYFLNKKEGGSHAMATGILTAGVAVLFWPAAPFMLLRHGKEAKVSKGLVFDVFTDQEHPLGPLSAPAAVATTAGSSPKTSAVGARMSNFRFRAGPYCFWG